MPEPRKGKPGDLGYPASKGEPTEGRGSEGDPAERTDNRTGHAPAETGYPGRYPEDDRDEEGNVSEVDLPLHDGAEHDPEVTDS